MVEQMRFLPVGTSNILVELADLETTLALLNELKGTLPEGVRELVPAARTLLIHYDPLMIDATKLIAIVKRQHLSRSGVRQGDVFEVPVVYDGKDLGDVAELLGWTEAELIRRHTEASYTVAFTGFAPGFAYMVCDDPALDVPRRKSPRVRVPAGTVALAGKFAGIYPSDSPGGWQLLGTTPLRMWDTYRPRPAMLTPGDNVRFRNLAKGASIRVPALTASEPSIASSGSGLRVIRADRPALFQDTGRPGRANQGISESGAMDLTALREANLCVGNPADAPALEVTLGGIELEAGAAVTVAVTGASCPVSIRAKCGREMVAPFGHPVALDATDILRLDVPEEGMRSYIALRGGFRVESVLGSASYDTLAKIGPEPVVAGSVLEPAGEPAMAVDPERGEQRRLPARHETVTLDLLMGPRTDWFTRDGVEALLSQKWQVTADSSRIALRLSGQAPIERRDTAELPSEAMVRGAVQVPHSGQPVVFLSDHPLTGGYPVIGVVASHHLDFAGQIPVGAWIRFNPIENSNLDIGKARR